MALSKLAALYALTLIAFLAVDFAWLSLATPRLYRPALSGLIAENPKLGAAFVFYLLYVVGVLVFAVVPGLESGSLVAALWRGALFGLLAYATYDLTNLATLRDWPVGLTLIDLAWGTAVTAATSLAGYYVGVWLKLVK